MRARRALPIAVAAVLSAAALSSPARADSHDDAEADAAIKRGVELRRHAKDQDALEEFRKAYALVKSPRALAQVGLAEQALGRWVDAENDLAEAMASKSDPWIRKNLSTLNGAVDVIRKHLGSLDVIGPAGAELLIDGHSAGTLPLAKPARVPIGSLTIEVQEGRLLPGDASGVDRGRRADARERRSAAAAGGAGRAHAADRPRRRGRRHGRPAAGNPRSHRAGVHASRRPAGASGGVAAHARLGDGRRRAGWASARASRSC